MNSWKKKPVTVIIADSGPLISLACADRLELLQSFGRPVWVVDVVRAECTRMLGAPGEDRLSHWFEFGGGNQFQELKTPFLEIFNAALEAEKTGEVPNATRGFGDAAISWLIPNLNKIKGKNETALVLTSDGPFGDGPVLSQRHAHVLSTREWLLALENLDIIPSAVEVLKQIEAGGDKVSRYMADRPALVAETTRSDWKDQAARLTEKDH